MILKNPKLYLKQLDSYIEQKNIENIICFLTYLNSKIGLVNSKEKELLILDIKYFNDLMNLENQEVDNALSNYFHLFRGFGEDHIKELYDRMQGYAIY